MPALEARLYEILKAPAPKRVAKEELNTILSDIRIVAETMIARGEFASAEKLIDTLLYSWLCDNHSGYSTHLDLVVKFNKGIELQNLMNERQVTAS